MCKFIAPNIPIPQWLHLHLRVVKRVVKRVVQLGANGHPHARLCGCCCVCYSHGRHQLAACQAPGSTQAPASHVSQLLSPKTWLQGARGTVGAMPFAK